MSEKVQAALVAEMRVFRIIRFYINVSPKRN